MVLRILWGWHRKSWRMVLMAFQRSFLFIRLGLKGMYGFTWLVYMRFSGSAADHRLF